MLIDSKSQLAKLLACENIIVEERKVRTASFNLKTRLLTVPILKQALSPVIYDLFTGHEVGHALFTPEEGWHDAQVDLNVPRSILNVMEDVRIEKLMKRKYPGLRMSFYGAYKELMYMNFFETENININNLNFVDRCNLHFKVGPSLGVRFSQEEKKLLKQIEETETFAEVVVIAKTVADLMRKQKKEQDDIRQALEDMGVSPGSDSSGEPDGSWDEDPEDPPDGSWDEDPEDPADNSFEPGPGDDAKQEDPEDKKNEEKSDDEDDGPIPSMGHGDPDLEEPEEEEEVRSYTDDAFRNKEKDLVTDDKVDYNYGFIPENISLEDIITPYTKILEELKTWNYYGDDIDNNGYISSDFDKKNFAEFRIKSNKVVSYLVKEFQLRANADQYRRASISKTGELNPDRLYQYQMTDDIFRRITVLPGGKSHGLVMFVDWSQSMHEHLDKTVKQLLNLILFCKKVNIPFEVYAFTSKNRGINGLKTETPEGYYHMHSFRLANFFSSKMTAAELSYMANALLKFGTRGYYSPAPGIFDMSSTPLNETIFAAIDIVKNFKENNKLQIVNTVFLTDGDGHTLGVVGIPRKWDYNINYVPALRHKKSGIFVQAKSDSSKHFTAAVLSMFKILTGSNVIGFYILGSRYFRSTAASFFPKGTDLDAVKKQFTKDKSITLRNAGYDEYHIMNANTDVDDDGEIETTSKTTRGLVSAFTKYSAGKVQNRIVLSKFIGMISGEVQNKRKTRSV
jgi:hypothetical protein